MSGFITTIKNLNNRAFTKVFFVLAVSVLQFLLFFYPALNKNTIITGTGSTDALSMHYPFRFYLYEKIVHEHAFPFWTERVHSGFPIYADLEKGFLSPINIATTVIFGPWWSYKLIYLIFYLAGSIGLYKFLKEYRIGFFGWFGSNLIYYFSFFHILRLQLFNSVLVSYTLPLNLYFLYRYKSSSKFRFLWFTNILNALNLEFGQLNYIFISVLAQLVYLAIPNESLNTRKIAKSVFFYIFIFFTCTIHAVYPAFMLFSQGIRSANDLSYLQGSFSPVSFLTAVYPYLFGNVGNYYGKVFNNDYFINEFYIYFGISALITAFIGFLKIKNKELFNFTRILLLLFFILGFINYLPLIRGLNIPPINLFRFWSRTSIYLLLCVSIFSAYAVENIQERLQFKRLFYFLGIFAYLLFLEFSNHFIYSDKAIITHIKNGGLSINCDFYFWLIMLLASFAVWFFSKYIKKVFITKFLLTLTIFADITFFGLNSIKYAFSDFNSSINIPNLESSVFNKRVIFLNDKIFFGNTYLYENSWSLLGYSGPFESREYSDYLKTLGFASQRKAGFLVNFQNPDPVFIDNMKKLGVSGVFNENFEFLEISNAKNSIELIYPIPENVSTKYIDKKEGLIEFEIENKNSSSINLNTLIRKDNGWQIYIDGEKYRIENAYSGDSKLYINILVPSGSHIVKFVYVPKDLLLGLSFTALMIILYLITEIILNKMK